MKQQLLNLFATPRDMTWEDILLNIVLAAVLGFFIFLSYALSHRGTIYSRKFNASLVILAVLTGTVMTVIGDILVVETMNRTGFTIEEYSKRHHGGYLGERSRELSK